MQNTLSALNPQQWTVPLPIEYGPGARHHLARLCRDFNISRPIIITDQGSLRLPFVDELQRSLTEAGLACGLYGGIEPNPTDQSVLAGAAAYRAWGADGIIALGGGSGLDGGKAVALVARQQRSELWAFDFDKPVPAGFSAADFAPVIAIPTTAGTGAETESTAMLTDTGRGIKGCVWHPRARPAAVILDPELTQSLPANLTAWTGCDAIIHALEAYFVPSFNPLSDGAALQALTLLWGSIDTAVERGHDLEARGNMLIGSCLAGVAFLKGLGLVHALSHMVGATYNTHHGLTNAVILPVVLRYNQAQITPRLMPVAQALGLPDAEFETFYNAVCALLDRLEIPRSLAELGVRQADVGAVARKAMGDPARLTNPRDSTQAQLEALLTQAINHARD
ncbi:MULTISPECIES: iron-containing alcohol dehydrogenase [Pseudomonas]|jgi:alcohol dehydrogenase class IV|uniref:Iron-containing alcohol dehydrogenase n=1 Tax=Pseudomonas qingdaonensis TaxID=2056231 RepID=A0ABX8E1R6_9PSED|nr:MULTISPECIES: iron-containing alcohol dehydrogenase [Pseudomonas]KTC24935.1 dehydrogenase [Pseudomonas putida]MCO7504371.1 iron-containing alcohol dehydrogenase [Pseudomonas sp. VE 267-6A]MCO7529581.1 iron-containing alcohol dehydrogenase [Pseudomonas sp. 2]MCP8347637.1 iron-containing alcohol dehydrogenase [Pseudomonas sp. FBF18]MDD1953646.1 iron-containing alcohol dehydrogenase [Pseudomonas sp. 8209]